MSLLVTLAAAPVSGQAFAFWHVVLLFLPDIESQLLVV